MINKIYYNIIGIVGGIILLIGINSNPMAFIPFVLGGTIFGFGVVGRCTNYFDFPLKESEQNSTVSLKFNPVPRLIAFYIFPLMYLFFGFLIGGSIYILTATNKSVFMIQSIDIRPMAILMILMNSIVLFTLFYIFIHVIGNREMCEVELK